MAFALAKENEEFISRMVRQGRFNNQSEVVREALRRMERGENSYLNPQPLSEQEAERIYVRNSAADQLELTGAKKSGRAIRRLIKTKKLKLADM